MADIAHVWGQDLQLGPSGDLAVVSADNEVQQRILHRLLTNLGDYPWQLGYGAGLPAQVGRVADGALIGAIIRQQLLLEPAVAQSPEPVVTVSATADGTVTATIRYADATTVNTVVVPSFAVT